MLFFFVFRSFEEGSNGIEVDLSINRISKTTRELVVDGERARESSERERRRAKKKRGWGSSSVVGSTGLPAGV